ncbi:hypothetical protein BEP19_16325 [Ammoniphilus oxalaticus]|uniref:Dihydrolipoyl dehydrogenase n=1 Tax=Ammoniphilus oxalaticus TaxID=66863 RepID=A0A419SQT2_9BACL|nr:NAD(P)/FAD-dependent oxidoreductase [Ammoniphilus oxalaticus]RKD26765.1 hypothetical protein BEP19_16325 [Ammoniphilus oxalaticus]
MPKKALVRSADVWNTMQDAAEFGIVSEGLQLNWQRVMERKNRLIGSFVGGKGPYLEKMGVDLVMGEAQFISPEAIQVGDTTYTANRFLIGVGSDSARPPIPGIEHAITSKEILFTERLPKSMVVIGGGIIGMEFAHIMASAGTKVTLLHRSERVLPMVDRDSAEAIQEISKKMGIDLQLRADIEKIEQIDDNQLVVHAQVGDRSLQIEAEVVLVATGRRPNIVGLQLDAAGVEYTNRGIKVNEYLQTTAEKIYAAGDAIGGYMFTPIAAHQAKVAVRNALRGNELKPNYEHMTNAIFTQPPISGVGMTEQEAREKELDIVVAKASYNQSGTAILLGETEGHIKIIADKQTGALLGAHFVGADADELIHMMTIAIKAKLTVQDFEEIIPVHPTLAEFLIETTRGMLS